jgi:predicted transposase YdaD
MRAFKYEYQSDFARHYFGEGEKKGRAEGRTEGRAEIVLRLLTVRFGQLDEATNARITTASAADLDAIVERALTAQTLQQALG